MLPIQNGLICWLDASDGKAGETLLKDRTSYGHNLVLENFQQGYGFTGKSIKVKKSGGGSTIGNALYIANGGFKTHCKSFCLCIERNNTSEPWYIFDGRGLSGQGSSGNHCFNGRTGASYDNTKTRKDGVFISNNSNLEINKKVFFYFELHTAELFTLSILMRHTNNESPEGQFYSLYAYDRALTEQEILHNMKYEKNTVSYVNDKNLPKIVEKLSNASNIKITGNKYGDRVQTVVDKIVEKADDVTKAINKEIINDSHVFKIGTGNNIDISSDVQDAFSKIAIKGQTYQNLYPKLDRSKYARLDWNIKFDGDIIKFNATSSYQNLFLKKEALSVKPNTTYTVIIDVLKNTIVNTQSDSMLDLLDTTPFASELSYFKTIIRLNKDTPIGRYKFIAVTREDFTQAEFSTRCCLDNNASSGELWIRYFILEGDHTNNLNLPSCFEGIVGVGDKYDNDKYKIEITTTSNNLCSAKTVNHDWLLGEFNTYISNKNQSYHSCEAFAIPHLANKKVYAGLIREGIGIHDFVFFAIVFDKNKVQIGNRFEMSNKGYILPNNTYYIRLMTHVGNTLTYIDKDVYYLGLEPLVVKKAYTSYREEKMQIILDEPLMRLPNGVCDEITIDGTLIRRVGKMHFSDFESKYKISPSQHTWSNSNSHGTYQWCNISNLINYKYYIINKTTPNILCDKYPYSTEFHGGGNSNVPNKFFAISNDRHARLMIAKKLVNPTDPSIVTNSMLKSWVEENCDLDSFFYYELATPVVTQLPVSSLRMFKEGYLIFNTLVAPESSHIVQLNKSAQIQTAIKQTQLLNNKVSILEKCCDNLMLSTMSTLNNLELDYTLKQKGGIQWPF